MYNDLKDKSYGELLEIVSSHQQKPLCAQYLFTFIHQKDATEIDAVTPLPKAFRQQLTSEGFVISSIDLLEQHDDPDGTIKFVFDLGDGAKIESVRLKDGDRNTLCISTQAGCRMGCKFCATGQLKFQRDLTAAEIVDQVYHAETICGRISNLVYMGMGEPLDNFENVMRSIELLNDKRGRNIGIRHITISTCGLPEEITQLAARQIRPRLAVSLHAPNDAIRSKLMRVGNKFPLEDIVNALRDYQRETGKRITIEYCTIDGVNDKIEHAKALLKRLKPLKINVNLIELNPFPGCRYKSSPTRQIREFAQILTQSGIETIIRFKRGRNIKAACGQLGATWLEEQ
ncbi:MAG: 23S rRNA (adenine(2503)-C(2))-methyltransferase [Planctomycetales bacterium 4572_13]|nr:MAG: 23S rRNA (adenine(2503)-C(2))-methyltransferase [Planctomycetales bacterium 4572_13]